MLENVVYQCDDKFLIYGADEKGVVAARVIMAVICGEK